MTAICLLSSLACALINLYLMLYINSALLVSHPLLGLLNVTWPFASLAIEKSRLRFSWKFLFLHKEYKIDFPEIVKIEFKREIFSKSLRFIHSSARAPMVIIF